MAESNSSAALFYQPLHVRSGNRDASMPEVRKSVLVDYSAQQMFDLVDAVESYPKFLPWCGGAQVDHRDERTTRATIRIAYRGIRQSFSTENLKEPPNAMHMKLVKGPFRTLDGSWLFHDLAGHGCRIEFRLHYEFSNRLLEKLVGPVFGYIAGTLVNGFIHRAENVYGGR